MDIKDEIYEILAGAVEELGLTEEGLSVTFSNRPELCDYQCNFAMIKSKALNEKPIELAEKIVKNLEKSAKNAKKDENFELETNTVWSFPNRGSACSRR